MADLDPRRARRFRRELAVDPAGQEPWKVIEPPVQKMVRLLLVPLQPARRAEDAERQPMLSPGRGLGDPQRPRAPFS
jgi:hypothetical protein